MSNHSCIQARRLGRIEREAAEIEQRRKDDVRKTAHTMRDVSSQFEDAIERMTDAAVVLKETAARNGELGRRLASHAAQIKKLFAAVDALAAKLEAG